jgi:predicted transcriptional regulator
MPAITIELTDDLAEDLRRLAATQERSETDLAREAREAARDGTWP